MVDTKAVNVEISEQSEDTNEASPSAVVAKSMEEEEEEEKLLFSSDKITAAVESAAAAQATSSPMKPAVTLDYASSLERLQVSRNHSSSHAQVTAVGSGRESMGKTRLTPPLRNLKMPLRPQAISSTPYSKQRKLPLPRMRLQPPVKMPTRLRRRCSRPPPRLLLWLSLRPRAWTLR